jgi:hypothetical protein
MIAKFTYSEADHEFDVEIESDPTEMVITPIIAIKELLRMTYSFDTDGILFTKCLTSVVEKFGKPAAEYALQILASEATVNLTKLPPSYLWEISLVNPVISPMNIVPTSGKE